jgi:hypothetical protein
VVEEAPAYITILSNTTTIRDNLDIPEFGKDLEDKKEEELPSEIQDFVDVYSKEAAKELPLLNEAEYSIKLESGA